MFVIRTVSIRFSMVFTNKNLINVLLVILIYADQFLCQDNYHDCKAFAKSIDSPVFAMPLLLRRYPYRIKRKKCVSGANPLIVGGQNVTRGEFPHMAAVGYTRGETVEWLCGGSLISHNYVLTAAHCAKTKWGTSDVVRVGSLRLDTESKADAGVKSAIIHPDYNPPIVYNDIALLELTADITFNFFVQPACLSFINDFSSHLSRPIVATGWGHTTSGGISSSRLLKVSLRIVQKEECREDFPRERNLPNGLDDTMFCATGYNEHFHDTCQGDSGGPVQMTINDDECTKQVIGITSFGKYCGSGSPAVYIKVASFLPWIQSVIVK